MRVQVVWRWAFPFNVMFALALAVAAQEKGQIHQSLHQAERACYQRFAVEDCLQAERRNAREALAAVRQNEAALDAKMRRERADQRLQVIDERLKSHPAPVSVVPPRHPLQPAKVRAVAPMAAAAVQARQKAALREASIRAARARAARERQTQKWDAAQAHKAQVEERAERAKLSQKSSGRPPAMSLPPPPS